MVSLKDVKRVPFGGNNVPYIRKSMKVAIFYRAAQNQGVAVLKEALKSIRIQKVARNATYVILVVPAYQSTQIS